VKLLEVHTGSPASVVNRSRDIVLVQPHVRALWLLSRSVPVHSSNHTFASSDCLPVVYPCTRATTRSRPLTIYPWCTRARTAPLSQSNELRWWQQPPDAASLTSVTR